MVSLKSKRITPEQRANILRLVNQRLSILNRELDVIERMQRKVRKNIKYTKEVLEGKRSLEWLKKAVEKDKNGHL